MPKSYSRRPGTWFLTILIKITTFLITTGFIIVTHHYESPHSNKAKLESHHE